MQRYKRKITYFYQYHNGMIGSTAGFLKLEIRGDKVKIIINIQEPGGLPYKEALLCFYHEAGDHLAALQVDHVKSENGMLVYQKRTDWQKMFDTERDLYTFDGVAVVYNETHYYIGDFKDKSRKDYALVLRENHSVKEVKENSEQSDKAWKPAVQEITDTFEQYKNGTVVVNDLEENLQEEMSQEETLHEEGTDKQAMQEEMSQVESAQEEKIKKEQEKEKKIFDRCETCPHYQKRKEQKEQADVFEKMLQEYPKLPMYGATELFDCVRIHPKDIGKLDMRNWKLGVNSFLTHGFYTYQYLMLGKMRFDDGKEKAIIGVPGVFSNREKYLANMFGFEIFVPVKKTGVKTGEFGYWIVEISPYL